MEDYLEGGFMASSQKHEYTGIKTLRCLSVKQINSINLDGTSSILLVDRFEVSNVQACGYISSCKKISTGLVFELDDTTGKLDCAFWTNGVYEELMSEQISDNCLVQVTGSLKTFGNKKTLNVSNVIKVTLDNLVYHLTNCLYQHLFFNNKIERTEPTKANNSMSFSKIQSDILDVYRNNQDNDGLDIEVVVAMLKEKYSENEVRQNVDNLLGHCHLYSVDGTNYKTTM